MKPQNGGNDDPRNRAQGARQGRGSAVPGPRWQKHGTDARFGKPPPAGPRRGPGGKPVSGPRPVGAGPSKPSGGKPAPAGRPTDWSEVADWYDKLVGDQGSEYHQKVVFPGVLRLLAPQPGEAVLDVACGQGALCRLLAGKGAAAVGVDAAEPLVAAAEARGPAGVSYHVGDARELERMPFLPTGHFASAACVLAIQNIHPIVPVFTGVARVLRPMGRFVVVMMHPCFRGPKATSWGWDGDVQYRRVDRYLLPRKVPIVTHPGSDPGAYTWTFHKPIEQYVRAARGAGLLVDALEEWPSHKTSQPGPRSAAENQAREEIPMFLAMRCVKVAGSA